MFLNQTNVVFKGEFIPLFVDERKEIIFECSKIGEESDLDFCLLTENSELLIMPPPNDQESSIDEDEDDEFGKDDEMYSNLAIFLAKENKQPQSFFEFLDQSLLLGLGSLAPLFNKIIKDEKIISSQIKKIIENEIKINSENFCNDEVDKNSNDNDNDDNNDCIGNIDNNHTDENFGNLIF